MKKTILVTDTLFILEPHVKRMQAAGFEVKRLEKLKATEQELIEAVQDVHGYILGGIESVTAPVIRAANKLEAICFTGSGFSEFIPAHKKATEKGIAITAAKGANAIDVAEFTIGLMFEMIRNFPLLRTRNGVKGNDFYTARRMQGLTVGIIGYGRIGSEVARIARSLGMNVLVKPHNQQCELPKGIRFAQMDELLSISDIVTLHVNKLGGTNVIDKHALDKMKMGAILINACFPEAVDAVTLIEKIEKRELRAAFDAPPHIDTSGCDLGYFTYSNAPTAFNTHEAIVDTSDRCTNSIINLLTKGEDVDVVNDFRKYRRA